jgi:hypothetical protein
MASTTDQGRDAEVEPQLELRPHISPTPLLLINLKMDGHQ